jgi:hypothetical protein
MNFPYRLLTFVLYESSEDIVWTNDRVTIRNRPFSFMLRSNTTKIRKAISYLKDKGYVYDLDFSYGSTSFRVFLPKICLKGAE